MEYEYDQETDILVTRLSKNKPDYGEQEGNIINHYDKDGKPVEIEILDASETVGKMVELVLRSRKHEVSS